MCVSDKLGESVRGWEEEEGGREGGKRKQGGSGVSVCLSLCLSVCLSVCLI